MNNAPITFRQLQPTTADLNIANQILGEAFDRRGNRWDAELRRYLTFEPTGYMLAYEADQPVGVGGAVNWGAFAYIGMVGVTPTHQGRGIGAQLMRQILAWVERQGCPLVVLDATAAGEPLYSRLGFMAEDQRLVMVRPAGIPVTEQPLVLPQETLDEGLRLAPITDADWPALLAYDASIFGADRQRLLLALWAELPNHGWLARDASGSICGYGLNMGNRLGPFNADSLAIGESILHRLLSLSVAEQPTNIICTARNQAFVQTFQRYGFTQQRSCIHMRRGSDATPTDLRRMLGQIAFAVG